MAFEDTPKLSQTEKGSMYIAIDDDIVFIGPHSLRHLIRTKQAHPAHTLLSANILSTSVIIPPRAASVQNLYLPEPVPLSPTSSFLSGWRASELPSWPNTPDTADSPTLYSTPYMFPPAGEKYRWLPLRDRAIVSTAFVGPDGIEGEGFGDVERGRYEMAVQAHYSFLENIEKNRLEQYLLRMPSRHSGGIMAVWDHDVRDIRILFQWRHEELVDEENEGEDGGEGKWEGEEDVLSIPTDGNAFAAKMDAGLEAVWRGTDLRERYLDYAREMVWREGKGMENGTERRVDM